MHRRPRLVLAAALAALLVPATAHAAPATSLRTGFLDGRFAGDADGVQRLAEAKGLGASVVRLSSGWRGLAPSRPARPTDPADPAYAWSGLDAAVVAAVAQGLTPVISLTSAPDWAEGPNRPASAVAGTWRPDPAAYEAFGQALARRYDGTYPDPARPGATLPRVRSFIAWNEPNLDLYLSPQYVRSGARRVPDAPVRYRRLVRGLWTGVHRAQPDGQVVAGALAPFGDPPGGRRTRPAAFLRTMLCLDARLRRASCGTAGPPRFDVLSHHPYSVRGPFSDALNTDDVCVPDIARKLIRPLRRAERLGLLGARRTRPVWVTEISWDSSPPDPDGVPSARHADWVAQSLYVLARQGIGTVMWFGVRDQLPGSAGYSRTNQSGMLLADGRAKRSATAFRFPLVAVRRGTSTTVWALAPGSGPLTIERRTATGWAPLLTRTVARGRTVTKRLALPAGSEVRARQGTATSLTAVTRRA